MFKISQFFDENPWRNKSSKLNIFGPLFSKTHSALFNALIAIYLMKFNEGSTLVIEPVDLNQLISDFDFHLVGFSKPMMEHFDVAFTF